MILAVDVQYDDKSAFVAGVLFDEWNAEEPTAEYISHLHEIEEYVPGNFYKRELPCILKLLNEHRLEPTCILVDGYVYLDGKQKPGLGKKLFDTLEKKIEIIGVAKRGFSGISSKYEILRGESEKPLYITTTGELEIAKNKVLSMCGNYRIPALLKRADQLCREAANKSKHMNDVNAAGN
ncbi:endonuclease V [Litoribrevibacter euphylliae]|uniref:Endonuclease V n=1 Tax=Litoribrevibacter euphylliae TaxID=1834034 RepID=A0ABV7H822_9GAMM